MLHFYDESPTDQRTMHRRLSPARALLSSGIPFVVWGEDALSFVHFVPTFLFEFHILVPDELVQAAAEHLLKELPEYRVTDRRPSKFVGRADSDRKTPSAIPNSVQLEWTGAGADSADPPTPYQVLIIAQSHIHFDVRDPTRTTGLLPPYDETDAKIRFPTQAAFFDALVDCIYEHRSGPNYHCWFYQDHCYIFLSYLVMYNVRVDEDEDPLDPERTLLDVEQKMLDGVAPRTRPFLEAYMRRAIPGPTPEMIAEREGPIDEPKSQVL